MFSLSVSRIKSGFDGLVERKEAAECFPSLRQASLAFSNYSTQFGIPAARSEGRVRRPSPEAFALRVKYEDNKRNSHEWPDPLEFALVSK